MQAAFDAEYGGIWNCMVGANFGASISHEESQIIFFVIEGRDPEPPLYCLLYRPIDVPKEDAGSSSLSNDLQLDNIPTIATASGGPMLAPSVIDNDDIAISACPKLSFERFNIDVMCASSSAALGSASAPATTEHYDIPQEEAWEEEDEEEEEEEEEDAILLGDARADEGGLSKRKKGKKRAVY